MEKACSNSKLARVVAAHLALDLRRRLGLHEEKWHRNAPSTKGGTRKADLGLQVGRSHRAAPWAAGAASEAAAAWALAAAGAVAVAAEAAEVHEAHEAEATRAPTDTGTTGTGAAVSGASPELLAPLVAFDQLAKGDELADEGAQFHLPVRLGAPAPACAAC